MQAQTGRLSTLIVIKARSLLFGRLAQGRHRSRILLLQRMHSLASAVNGIYPEDVADLPTIETAIPRLREIFAGADEIIGYNVGFDLGFLSAVGVRPREDARITDTMNLFTWFMGRRYKLVDAADHIGYEWTGRAHGSLADALATLAVQRWLEQWLVAE